MADEFEIRKAKSGMITVSHIGDGHRYTFYVAEDETGQKVLGSVVVNEKKGARQSGSFYMAEARSFAEREARKAGLFDAKDALPRRALSWVAVVTAVIVAPVLALRRFLSKR